MSNPYEYLARVMVQFLSNLCLDLLMLYLALLWRIVITLTMQSCTTPATAWVFLHTGIYPTRLCYTVHLPYLTVPLLRILA